MSAISAALPRVRALSPRLVLGAIVLLGAVVQELVARTVTTPGLFPDEYLYSQLGRSLAQTGHLAVRGVDPHFLPVLAPVVNAPFWLFSNVETAYRLIQAENAVLLSLAAIPTYLLARRLGASARLAYLAAALAVLGPPAYYSSRLLAEPIAYPLFVAVVALGVEVIEQPTRRRHVAFLVLAALATLARLQLALLPLLVVAAVLVIGLREHRLRATLREQRLLVGAVGGALLLGLTVLAVRGFGYYHVGIEAKSAGTAGRIGAVDLFVVAISTGGALAPSAVVGLAQAIGRPRGRREQAFGLIAALAVVGLVAQSVLWGDVGLVQERYLIYLVPLLAVGFCLRWSRSDRRPLGEIGVAAAIAAIASLVPLSSYAIDDASHIVPALDAVAKTQIAMSSPSSAASIFALGVTALAAIGALAATLHRGALPTLVVSLAAAATVFGLAAAWASPSAATARRNFMPADRHWIDHVAPGDKTLLVVGKASAGGTLMNLFWNPSVTHVIRTASAGKGVDWLDDPLAAVGADGTLHVGGKPVTGTVAVATDPVAVVVLAGAHVLAANGPITVWHTSAPARLGILLFNRMLDGTVLQSGAVRVWETGGFLVEPITAPAHLPATVVFGGGHVRLTVHAPAGRTAVARIPVCGKHGWSGVFIASPSGWSSHGWLAPKFAKPRFVADPSACR